jgi:hypothetical protein
MLGIHMHGHLILSPTHLLAHSLTPGLCRVLRGGGGALWFPLGGVPRGGPRSPHTHPSPHPLSHPAHPTTDDPLVLQGKKKTSAAPLQPSDDASAIPEPVVEEVKQKKVRAIAERAPLLCPQSTKKIHDDSMHHPSSSNGIWVRPSHTATVVRRTFVQPKGRIAEYNDDSWNDEMPDVNKEVGPFSLSLLPLPATQPDSPEHTLTHSRHSHIRSLAHRIAITCVG